VTKQGLVRNALDRTRARAQPTTTYTYAAAWVGPLAGSAAPARNRSTAPSPKPFFGENDVRHIDEVEAQSRPILM
jgi:hypothetical protein